MAFPASSIIENNILFPVNKVLPPDYSGFYKKTFVEHLFERVRENVQKKGDCSWLTNGAILAEGSSLAFGDETVRISEVEPKSQAIANILHHIYKVGKGDVVHIILPNTTQFYFPVFGTWILQGVISPADPGLSPQVLARQFQEAKSKVIFCCIKTLDKVKAAKMELGNKIQIIVLDLDDDSDEEDESIRSLKSLLDQRLDNPPASFEFDENVRSLICWSSGTTGRPKGIQHGSRLLYTQLFEKPDEKMILQATCMFHMGGFVSPISALVRGSPIVFISSDDLDVDSALLFKVAAKANPSLIMCGSHHGIQMASMELPEGLSPIPSVTTIWPVGTNVYDGIAVDLKSKFPSLLGVGNVYGQSEILTAVAVSLNQKDLGGLYHAMTALKFVDPVTGEAVGPHTVGEFAVKASKNVMLGYLNHREENDHFFGKDGFLYMGDFGHYDENGVIYYDGRIKELIKYKNIHLYPNEIEELILNHPKVKDVAVFGKPEPSVQELVTALVVIKEGSDVSSDEIMKLVEEELDDHKKLRGGVYFVDKIPRNPQGKILRGNLIEIISM